MVLAFGAMEPLAVAAAALSRGVLVAAAGVVVVLAILLVFVMVLRGAGSSRKKASGIDYDAQQGPVGQPHSAAREPAPAGQWNQAPQGDRFAADQGYDQGYDQSYDQGYDQGYDQNYDQGFGQERAPNPQQGWGQPAQANAAPWGAPDAADGAWNDRAAPAARPMGGANEWGAAQPQARPANPWDAPAGAGQWNGGGAPPPRPGAGNNGANAWDAPAQAQAWDAPAQAPNQPAAPSQPAWNGQPPAPSQPAWGAQPPAPSQPAWNGQPATPSGAGWGAQPDPALMQATVSRNGSVGKGAPRLVERKTDGSGREFDLSKDRLTIGRHRESDVFLEDLAVSRLHTTISHDPSGRYILRDENSANGTYVNGQRVTEQVLKDGDEVQVGQTVLVFQQ